MKHTATSRRVHAVARALCLDLGRVTPKPKNAHGQYRHYADRCTSGTQIDVLLDTYTDLVQVLVDGGALSGGIGLYSADPGHVSLDRTASHQLRWERLWREIAAEIEAAGLDAPRFLAELHAPSPSVAA